VSRSRFFDGSLRAGRRGEAGRLVLRQENAKTRIGNGHAASADQIGVNILAGLARFKHLVDSLESLGKFFPARDGSGTTIGNVVSHD